MIEPTLANLKFELNFEASLVEPLKLKIPQKQMLPPV
jgi:hypothetical protein